jgi:hypothetical protein
MFLFVIKLHQLFNVSLGPNMIGVPPLKCMDSLRRLPNSPSFSLFPWLALHFFFFLMLNEIILFHNLCRPLKVSVVFTYESEYNKIYSMWVMFYQWPKIKKKLIFWNLLHCNRAFGSSHIHTHFIYIST